MGYGLTWGAQKPMLLQEFSSIMSVSDILEFVWCSQTSISFSHGWSWCLIVTPFSESWGHDLHLVSKGAVNSELSGVCELKSSSYSLVDYI